MTKKAISKIGDLTQDQVEAIAYDHRADCDVAQQYGCTATVVKAARKRMIAGNKREVDPSRLLNNRRFITVKEWIAETGGAFMVHNINKE